MEVIIGALVGIALILAIWAGVFGLFWCLWTAVVPQIWETGPENVIRPGFWLFVGACLVIRFVGGLLFGRGKKE